MPRLVFLSLVAMILLAPFAIWAGVYAALRQGQFTPESMFRVLRAWRWIAWIAAVLLALSSLPPFHLLPWLYFAGASTFSLGLSFPEAWLKKRLTS